MKIWGRKRNKAFIFGPDINNIDTFVLFSLIYRLNSIAYLETDTY